jgi:hypothetical protein
MREVKEWLALQNLRIHHVMIRSELNYLIGANYLRMQWPGFEVEIGPNANDQGFSRDKTFARVRFGFQP